MPRKSLGLFQMGFLMIFTNCVNADLGRINLQLHATIVSPTCELEPGSRNVAIDLPDYPGEASLRLKLTCPFEREVKYLFSGSTTDKEGSIFTNTSSNTPAQGVGIQLTDRFGVIKVNQERNLGHVNSRGKVLELRATYAANGVKVQAGNVQSVVSLTFVYP